MSEFTKWHKKGKLERKESQESGYQSDFSRRSSVNDKEDADTKSQESLTAQVMRLSSIEASSDEENFSEKENDNLEAREQQQKQIQRKRAKENERRHAIRIEYERLKLKNEIEAMKFRFAQPPPVAKKTAVAKPRRKCRHKSPVSEEPIEIKYTYYKHEGRYYKDYFAKMDQIDAEYPWGGTEDFGTRYDYEREMTDFEYKMRMGHVDNDYFRYNVLDRI